MKVKVIRLHHSPAEFEEMLNEELEHIRANEISVLDVKYTIYDGSYSALIMYEEKRPLSEVPQAPRVGNDFKTLEMLAAQEHERWSNWMRYLFSKCQHHEDGSCTIPPWAVERWQRQAYTEYLDLPEEERESDRQEVRETISPLAELHEEGGS